ncbi:MAG: MazG nucleotide pyrophosphohydrolase domain-containing protein [Victivallaceae bacterium]
MNRKDFDAFFDLKEMIVGIIKDRKCFWSNKQTPYSLLNCLEEECRELFDALHSENQGEIVSEIGDVLSLAVMLCAVAERENLCDFEEPALEAMDKIRRRSPYVFDDSLIVDSSEEAERLWAELKLTEKSSISQETINMTSDYPTFVLIDRVLNHSSDSFDEGETHFESEEELGHLLYRIFHQSKQKNLNPEKALRKVLLNFLSDSAAPNLKDSVEE